jgi:chromosome segregation ATPase|tara:strand:- start:364 stop:789 length:426 start_codon:yes stop_codon:yes gene_type:complete
MSAKENILALDQKLSAQRNEWSNNIKALAQNLRKLNGLEVVIADVLSSRQTLVDQMAYLNMKVKEQKTKVASRYRTAYIKYYEYDYKLGEKQKERFIETDLADDNMILSHLENQIEFLRESVKTLDNMGFAIRNRLALKDL